MWRFVVLGVLFRGTLGQYTEADGQAFVEEYDAKVGVLWNENGKAAWEYYTNITDYNLEVMVCMTEEIRVVLYTVRVYMCSRLKLDDCEYVTKTGTIPKPPISVNSW
jgi:hypothetical protein